MINIRVFVQVFNIRMVSAKALNKILDIFIKTSLMLKIFSKIKKHSKEGLCLEKLARDLTMRVTE